MAIRVNKYIRKLEVIRDNLRSDTNIILNKHKLEIIQLNKSQISDGYGSDNRNLFNVLRQYDGVYNQGYKKSGLYDFYETGSFLRGFFVEINTKGIFIDSNGKGTGDKSLFITSYTNLFGLNTDSIGKLRVIILPERKQALKRRL